MSDERWMEQALCRETDPEAFFVDKGGSVQPAKRICALCHVQPACLEWALHTRQMHGVLGGKSEKERRKILRLRERQTRVPAGAR